MAYSEKKVQEILDEAQILISNGFTKGKPAADKWRHTVDATSPSACKFCTIGAIERASTNVRAEFRDELEAIWRVRKVLTGNRNSIAYVNDSLDTKQEHIFDVFTLVKLGAWKGI